MDVRLYTQVYPTGYEQNWDWFWMSFRRLCLVKKSNHLWRDPSFYSQEKEPVPCNEFSVEVDYAFFLKSIKEIIFKKQDKTNLH